MTARKDKPAAPETLLAHVGGDPFGRQGAVNPPVYHASTVLFRSVQELLSPDAAQQRAWRYGRHGSPTSDAFEAAMTELEGGYRAQVFPSGLSACTTTLLAYAESGGHILITDSAYAPTRNFARDLGRLGVAAEFYDPGIGAGIATLIRPETRLIFLESPGSLTFEVQDLPAIVAAARARGVATAIDNTWSGGVYLKPLGLGVDVSIHAATKYICGHSDAMLGVTVCNEASWPVVKRAAMLTGASAGPDDVYLALRGLRTLPARLARQGETGLALARWLAARPEVVRVLHPALPGDPGHALWRRDFTGTSGLFAFELAATSQAALGAMLDPMRLFKMGFSWGGFESLILPLSFRRDRDVRPWTGAGPLLRISAGLEAPADLIRDLDEAFARLKEAA